MSIYGALKKKMSGLSHQQKESIAKCLGGREGWLLRSLRSKAKHDEIYDEKYYEHVEQAMAQSARAIAESVVQEFKPRTLIDVGCGSGALLREFKSAGIKVEGLEYSEAALRICRAKGLVVNKFNLESEARISPEKLDLCISTEVAKYIPEVLSWYYKNALVLMRNTSRV